MESKKIILYYKDIPISTLTFANGFYIHEVNKDNLNKALENGCPSIILGSIERKGEELPPIFYDFEIAFGRERLREKLGIKEGDNRFTRLYKRALKSDDFLKDGFWIDAKE